jgi:hypothetical protein
MLEAVALMRAEQQRAAAVAAAAAAAAAANFAVADEPLPGPSASRGMGGGRYGGVL